MREFQMSSITATRGHLICSVFALYTENILDIYRRQARSLAWYDQEGEPSSHNPFKKFRRRPQRTPSIQLESRAVTSRSLGDIPLSEDRRRRYEMNNGVGGPEYSSTFPPDSAGSDQVASESIDRNGPEPSMRSQDPLNGSSTARGPDVEGGQAVKPRKRKGLFGKFGHDNAVDEPEDSKSMADGPRFTVASQLRATILNSWINILIVAAPVGSRLFSVLGCLHFADCRFQLRCMLLMLILLLFLLSTSSPSCKNVFAGTVSMDCG